MAEIDKIKEAFTGLDMQQNYKAGGVYLWEHYGDTLLRVYLCSGIFLDLPKAGKVVEENPVLLDTSDTIDLTHMYFSRDMSAGENKYLNYVLSTDRLLTRVLREMEFHLRSQPSEEAVLALQQVLEMIHNNQNIKKSQQSESDEQKEDVMLYLRLAERIFARHTQSQADEFAQGLRYLDCVKEELRQNKKAMSTGDETELRIKVLDEVLEKVKTMNLWDDRDKDMVRLVVEQLKQKN